MPELRRVLGSADLGYDLVYCSRSGPPQARWLEPDVNDFLEEIAGDENPLTGTVVVPIGFICDHMEVVYDLDTEAKETAARLGIPYERADTVATDPAFVSSLVDVLEERAAQARGEQPVPVTVTGTGPFHTVCPSDCCLSPARPDHPGPAASAHPGAARAPHSSGAPARAAGQPATTQEDSMSTPHPHAVVPPSRTRRTRDIPRECRTVSVSTPRATRPATRAPRRRPTRTLRTPASPTRATRRTSTSTRSTTSSTTPSTPCSRSANPCPPTTASAAVLSPSPWTT